MILKREGKIICPLADLSDTCHIEGFRKIKNQCTKDKNENRKQGKMQSRCATLNWYLFLK